MAKKRKNAKSFSIAGFKVPRRMRRAALDAVRTPLGKVILAEAFIQAAAFLVSKHPTAAAAAAGAGTATAAKDIGGGMRDAAVNFMQGTAHALKESIVTPEPRKKKNKDTEPRASTASGARDFGNGGAGVIDSLDPDTIRQALLGELSRKKKRKKVRGENRH